MSRFENVAVFKDTEEACKSNPRLMESIRKSCAGQIFVREKDSVPDGSTVACFDTDARIVVSKKRTFEAAQAYVGTGDRVCVLNFASSSNPGGGVASGAGAQEECLCRVSTLYFTLDTDENWKRFYSPHRKARDPLHNDDILYSKDVTVFKSDTMAPKRLPETEWFDVDVLTCAAPNLREHPSNSMNSGDGARRIQLAPGELRRLHEKRLSRILDVAAANGEEAIVLGAFGCGAFRNDPRVVAAAAAVVMPHYRMRFKVIEFAIYCRPGDTQNYDAFKTAFGL